MADNINVKIKFLKENITLPEYATNGSAAIDLRCADETQITIKPRGTASISTGIAISLPGADVAALIFARSGLASKFGISLSNSVGVIDSDYRGEIKVSLINNSDTEFTVNPGDRIAQMMFVPIFAASFQVCDSLDETDRGTGGFGSTGI